MTVLIANSRRKVILDDVLKERKTRLLTVIMQRIPFILVYKSTSCIVFLLIYLVSNATPAPEKY